MVLCVLWSCHLRAQLAVHHAMIMSPFKVNNGKPTDVHATVLKLSSVHIWLPAGDFPMSPKTCCCWVLNYKIIIATCVPIKILCCCCWPSLAGMPCVKLKYSDVTVEPLEAANPTSCSRSQTYNLADLNEICTNIKLHWTLYDHTLYAFTIRNQAAVSVSFINICNICCKKWKAVVSDLALVLGI